MDGLGDRELLSGLLVVGCLPLPIAFYPTQSHSFIYLPRVFTNLHFFTKSANTVQITYDVVFGVSIASGISSSRKTYGSENKSVRSGC